MPLRISSKCAHHQVVKIALHSLWYRHTYRWPSDAQVERGLSQPVHQTATYRCDDTKGCVMQFWPPDDEHMCSKHVAAWNKLVVKEKFCASIWLITEINWHVLCFLIDYPWPGWDGSSISTPSTKFHFNPVNGQSTEKHNTYQLFCIYSIPPDDGLHMCQKHVECWMTK